MSEVAAFTRSRMSPAIGILFVGDRFACCDEGVGILVEGELVGIATIAPKGEAGSDGTPAIVGVFVARTHRGRGYGVALTQAAVERCRERGFTRVRVDVMSTGMKQSIARLPADLRALLDVYDQSTMLDHLP